MEGMKSVAPGKDRWTIEEHRIFLAGLERHGTDWNAISNLVKTRTPDQTRIHHELFDGQTRKGQQTPEQVGVVRCSSPSIICYSY